MRFLAIQITLLAATLQAAEPVALRVETLTVPPSTQPLAFVSVKNLEQTPYQGQISLQGPEDWRLTPSIREVTLEPGETQRVAFNIEQGRNREANTYAFQVTATGNGGTVTRQQETFVASAPYFKIVADGAADEWKDAIPITFSVGGKRTAVSTYWNRRTFSLLVAVQEDRLIPYAADGTKPLDAVQFSLAPLEVAGGTVEPAAGRFEYLLAAKGDGGVCFQLADMTTPLTVVQQERNLATLACEDAQVAVRRDGDTTWYECSLSFGPLRDSLTPSEGREFYFSVLVHDPDGAGIRDLGRHAELQRSDDDRTGWSRWTGAVWGDAVPRSPRIRWGMCTSKY